MSSPAGSVQHRQKGREGSPFSCFSGQGAIVQAPARKTWAGRQLGHLSDPHPLPCLAWPIMLAALDAMDRTHPPITCLPGNKLGGWQACDGGGGGCSRGLEMHLGERGSHVSCREPKQDLWILEVRTEWPESISPGQVLGRGGAAHPALPWLATPFQHSAATPHFFGGGEEPWKEPISMKTGRVTVNRMLQFNISCD